MLYSLWYHCTYRWLSGAQIMFFIVLGQHVSILTESSSDPSKKIDPYLENIIKVCCV